MKHRYFIRVSFTYVRSQPKKEPTSPQQEKQFYFVTGRHSRRQRTPTRGYFEFSLKNTNNLKIPIILYSEIIKEAEGMVVDIPLKLKRKSSNPLKADHEEFSITMSSQLGNISDSQMLRHLGAEMKFTINVHETKI